jgi:peptidoglycan/xylan/chitin deacetylase (PgdA/CDA1 family)
VRPTRQAAVSELLPEIAQAPVTRRRARHHLLRGVVVLAAVLVVLAVFGGTWVIEHRHDGLDAQHDTGASALAPADRARYLAAAARPMVAGEAPIVLTYHDINPVGRDSTYIVRPVAFEAQMQMLHAAGYRTLTADQFAAYVQGRFVPAPRSVLITFDDGTAGLWVYADRILARYGFHAVSFVITGRVGTHRPYYLTWPEIAHLSRTGRWDFESHTHDLHSAVPIGPGRVGSNLSNRIYTNGALESMDDFRTRVSGDLQRSVDDLVAHDLPRPQLFAYPFSDIVGKVTDRTTTQFPKDVVAQLFTASFVDISPTALPASRRVAAIRMIQRLEVFTHDTDGDIFGEMTQMSTLPVAVIDPLTTDPRWFEDGGHPAPVRVGPQSVSVDAASLTYAKADWAPQRTSDWVGYRADATVAGLSEQHDVTGSVRARAGSAAEITVRVSAHEAQISDATGKRLQVVRVPSRASHRVTITVHERATEIRLDGGAPTIVPCTGGDLSHGGIGIAVRRAALPDPFPTFGALRVTPDAG